MEQTCKSVVRPVDGRSATTTLSDDMRVSHVSRLTRGQLQSLVFLAILPAMNWVFISTTLFDMGAFSWAVAGKTALRLWLLFGVSLLVIRALQAAFPTHFDQDRFWPQLVGNTVVILGCGAITNLVFGERVFLPPTESLLMLRVFLILEIIVYVAVLWMLRQKELRFETAERLNDTELHLLKMQSNPHFLFNTLNLITAEISVDPEQATETIFDLADLLRVSVQLGERRRVSVSEELGVVDLYLRLQKKRFNERLTYRIDTDPETEDSQIPALLLQPVIENTIKWAVAPHAGAASISVSTLRLGNRLEIVVTDNGPPFDEARVVEGDGFRILRGTLEREYRDDHKVSLRSTSEGGVFTINLPYKPLEQMRD
ncbi:MAG: histidine kinase [Pseudomonadota bacterium]